MNLITQITEQKKNKSRRNIFIDGEYYCSLDIETIVKHGIEQGMTCSAEYFDGILQEDEYKKAMDTALKMLSYSKLKAEIEKRLSALGFTPEVADRVLEKLEEWHYVDDEAYIRCSIRAKLKAGKSLNETRHALLQKGAPKELLQSLLCEHKDFERESARLYVQKKLKNPASKEDMLRLRRNMYAKGFPVDVIRRALAEAAEGEEEEEFLE